MLLIRMGYMGKVFIRQVNRLRCEFSISSFSESEPGTDVATSYAYTTTSFSGSPFLTNKRFFAMVDIGIPDGIKCDLDGNVYSGCGDGVHIWSPCGTLIGKITSPLVIVPTSVSAMMNENRVWKAHLDGGVIGATKNLTTSTP